MILHTDVPTRAQVDGFSPPARCPSVSIYLATSPTSRGDAERIELKNLAGEASRQLQRASAGRGDIAAIDEELGELIDDDEFWRHQARSLALFLTPTTVTTFRLANHLVNLVEVSDRFHLKPLLRAVTFPNTAFVLALAQQSVRLLEITSDLEPMDVELADLPTDVASAVGKSSIRDRAPSGRVQGSEGQKTRMRQYARQIDHALRPLLNGLDLPLILAAAEPIDSIYRSVNSYPNLASASIPGNPETMSDAELAGRAREVLDDLYAAELRAIRSSMRSDLRNAVHRPTSPTWRAPQPTVWSTPCLSTSTRSSPAVVDEETGAVTIDDADDAVNYGVVDEIARRVWLNGGRVLAVRRDDIPGEASVAAIFRYAP